MALTQRQLEWAKANGINPEKVLPVATSSDKLTPDAVYSYLSNKGYWVMFMQKELLPT
jgi:hypothetical protein